MTAARQRATYDGIDRQGAAIWRSGRLVVRITADSRFKLEALGVAQMTAVHLLLQTSKEWKSRYCTIRGPDYLLRAKRIGRTTVVVWAGTTAGQMLATGRTNPGVE